MTRRRGSSFPPHIGRSLCSPMKDSSTSTSELATSVGRAPMKGPRSRPNPPKGNMYEARTSILDQFERSSNLSQSQFWGIANLVSILSGFYLVVCPLVRWHENRVVLDATLARVLLEDAYLLLIVGIKCNLWAFTALGIHILFSRKWIGYTSLSVLQHLSQGMLIAYSVAAPIVLDMGMIPTLAVILMGCVCFMKMHSFTMQTLKMLTKQEFHNDLYPQCISVPNFLYFLAAPALVYEPVYPKGGGFRASYFLQKLVALLGATFILYLLATNYVIPTALGATHMSFMETYARLLFPILLGEVLLFYIIFECICNMLAEVCNFADREFYQDWWNTTSWDEYSRRWNRPVHEFLLRHVYIETRYHLHWSRRDASVATFLFSACFHELIMAVCFRFVRCYLVTCMLLQLPIMYVGGKYLRKKVAGNIVFWFLKLMGCPLLACCYIREWSWRQNLSSVSSLHIL